MPGVFGLLGLLVFNYRRYKRGKPTICATFRRYVPRWAVAPFWAGVSAYMVPHLWRGYPRRLTQGDSSWTPLTSPSSPESHSPARSQ